MGINSSTETGSNNDENSDEDGLRGSKRARQLRSSIENINAENSNNSSSKNVPIIKLHQLVVVVEEEEEEKILKETARRRKREKDLFLLTQLLKMAF